MARRGARSKISIMIDATTQQLAWCLDGPAQPRRDRAEPLRPLAKTKGSPADRLPAGSAICPGGTTPWSPSSDGARGREPLVENPPA